jgi:hypothetical protein
LVIPYEWKCFKNPGRVADFLSVAALRSATPIWMAAPRSAAASKAGSWADFSGLPHFQEQIVLRGSAKVAFPRESSRSTISAECRIVEKAQRTPRRPKKAAAQK